MRVVNHLGRKVIYKSTHPMLLLLYSK